MDNGIGVKMSIQDYLDSLKNTKGIKANIKKRMFSNILEEIAKTENALYSALQTQKEELEAQKGLLQTQKEELEAQRKALDKQMAEVQAEKENLGAVARQVMLAKWKTIDSNLHLTESPEDILTCDICGESHKRSEFEAKETECSFYGGKLVRYVCPNCGVIFGATKFTSQTQKEIDEDYWVHYIGFKEGDSTYKEERAFFMLKPTKDKVYLNYGCGKWTKSLQKLREMGYKVYGYEPYAPELDNPYLITDKEQLSLMKFDGIYSNDVLEHFIHPVEDMIFMASLLRGPDGVMAHCTSCYTYKYEYTRFHTHFFTGKSVEVLAEKAGLEVVEKCNDIDENDFYCCVFKPKVYAGYYNYINKMHCLNNARIEDGKAYIDAGGLIYGPYLDLRRGSYEVVISLDGNANGQITANRGNTLLKEFNLENKNNVIIFFVSDVTKDIEFIVKTDCQTIVKKINLKWMSSKNIIYS